MSSGKITDFAMRWSTIEKYIKKVEDVDFKEFITIWMVHNLATLKKSSSFSVAFSLPRQVA